MEKGIIVNNISNLYYIKSEGRVYECSARGKFKEQDVTPVVGDIVEIEVLDEENGKAVVNSVCPRKTLLKRPKIANVTQMILVVSAKMPKPDLLMLDKQLVYVEYLGIKPIIVINKIDLSYEMVEKVKEIYTNIGYEVIETEARNSRGIENLKLFLHNNISGFSGNSGVGKSTLINSIFQQNITLEGEISTKNKKGKNTTTATKLYEIDQDSFIIDTPGFSTFDVDEIKSEELDKYFIEFSKSIHECEYVGCTHIKEEACAIKELFLQGEISESRYNNYIKIYNDLKEKEKRRW